MGQEIKEIFNDKYTISKIQNLSTLENWEDADTAFEIKDEEGKI